jgi:hypothetical protein
VVETIRLESGHTLTGIVGSNPTLSAIYFVVFKTTLIDPPLQDSRLLTNVTPMNARFGVMPPESLQITDEPLDAAGQRILRLTGANYAYQPVRVSRHRSGGHFPRVNA